MVSKRKRQNVSTHVDGEPEKKRVKLDNSSSVSVKKVSTLPTIIEAERIRISNTKTSIVIDVDNDDVANEIVENVPRIQNLMKNDNQVMGLGCDRTNLSPSERRDGPQDEEALANNGVFSSESLRCLTDLISTDGWMKVTKQGLLCIPCGKWYSRISDLLSHFKGRVHKDEAEKYEVNGSGPVPCENKYENWHGKCYPCDKVMRLDEWVDHFNDSNHRKMFEDVRQKPLPAGDFFRCTCCLTLFRASQWSVHEDSIPHQQNRILHEFVASRKNLTISCTKNVSLVESCSDERSKAAISMKTGKEHDTNESNPLVIDLVNDDVANEIADIVWEVQNPMKSENEVMERGCDRTNLSSSERKNGPKEEKALTKNEVFSSESLRCLADLISTDGWVKVTEQGLLCVPCGKWYSRISGLLCHFKGRVHNEQVDKCKANGNGPVPCENKSKNWYGKCSPCNEMMRLDEWVAHFKNSKHRKLLKNWKKKPLPADDCMRCTHCLTFVKKSNWSTHENKISHHVNRILHEFVASRKNLTKSSIKSATLNESCSEKRSKAVTSIKIGEEDHANEANHLVIDLDNGDDKNEIIGTVNEIQNSIKNENEVVVEGCDEENPSPSKYEESAEDEKDLVKNKVFSSESLRCLTDLISTDGWVKVTKQGLLCIPCGKWHCTIRGLLGHFTGRAHKKKADNEANGRGSRPRKNQYTSWHEKCRPCNEMMRLDEWVDHFNGSKHRKLLEDFQQKALPADDSIRCMPCLTFVEKSEWNTHENQVSHKVNRILHEFAASRGNLSKSCTKNANLNESCSEERWMDQLQGEAAISIEMGEEDRTNEVNVDECLMLNDVITIHSDEELNETRQSKKGIDPTNEANVEECPTVNNEINVGLEEKVNKPRRTKHSSLDECASVDDTGQFVFCKPCGRWLQSLAYWRRHSAGEAHKKELARHGPNGDGLGRPDVPKAYKQAQMLKCELCSARCYKRKWSVHIAGKKHRTEVERFLKTALPDPSKYRRCRSCAVDVKLHSWKQHLADRVHRLNAKKKKC